MTIKHKTEILNDEQLLAMQKQFKNKKIRVHTKKFLKMLKSSELIVCLINNLGVYHHVVKNSKYDVLELSHDFETLDTLLVTKDFMSDFYNKYDDGCKRGHTAVSAIRIFNHNYLRDETDENYNS